MDRIPLSHVQLLPTAACIFVAYIAYLISTSLFSTKARFFRQQDHAGRKGWFSSFDTITGSRAILLDSYSKFSKAGQFFAFTLFGGKVTMMVPQDKIHEFINKPDSQVASLPAIREDLALYWQGDMDIDEDPIHHEVVRHQLTRKLPLLTEAVHEELKLGFETEWKDANETEWIDVPAFQSCARIVSRAANRVFCGAELCKNPEFLDASLKYAEAFFTGAQIITMIPWFLKPFIAPFVVRRKQAQSLICEKWAVPVIEKRLREGEPQNDCISWLIEECQKRDSIEMEPNRMCRRIVRLNMAAIHTTTLTMTNTLLDLYSSPNAEEYIAGLREEVERVYSTHGNRWTKAAVNELHRVDSTIKESMRLSGIALQQLNRKVVHKDGTYFGETHIPHNVVVAVPVGAIHRDPDFYKTPDSFDAFRFSRSREALDSAGNVIDKKSQAIVTTSDKFLGFGHGRHACPGRFFASQEMKLMLAHLVVSYDVRIDGGRLPNVDFKISTIPAKKAELQVRLRKQ